MITYENRVYGFSILTRFHGSAAYKSITPATVSTAFYVLFYYLFELHKAKIFDHPCTSKSTGTKRTLLRPNPLTNVVYFSIIRLLFLRLGIKDPMGALMSAFTFLLIFKANFSYSRYWEAVTSVHLMHSKWLDVGMNLAAFHLQSDMYKFKPPSFGEHPNVQHLHHHRDRLYEPVPLDELARSLESTVPESTIRNMFKRRLSKPMAKDISSKAFGSQKSRQHRLPGPINPVDPLTEHPSLFLQEAAHLLSLLSAVAMSTLRNDVEAAESPLATFRCGAPWPAVDPDSPTADIRKGYNAAVEPHFRTVCRYLLGLTRTDRDRTMYNAARPFRVIGGVSDSEIELLQAARGPFAKVALVSVWLEEFMCREYLQGSAGQVGAPIISRNFQFLSDGMLGYNQARKIAYVPFPFPHAQITNLFVVVIIVYIPVLMLTFVNQPAMGASLNFFTVMCFAGLHEVARELENPFQNVPNDVPLNNFQAQFNEGLMNMFTGYHPDAYWLSTQVEANHADRDMTVVKNQ